MSTPDPTYSALLRRIEELEQAVRGNPLRSASVRRGTTEWKDASTLLITDSNMKVVGTAEVFGILRVVGTVLIEGLGRLVVNSLIDLLGSMRVRGGGGISVEDGGKIKAGDVEIRDGKVFVAGMVLDPSDHGGKIAFPNGAEVFTDSDTVQVFKGNSVVQVSDDYARLQNGGNVVEINDDGIRMSLAAIATLPGTGLPAGTLIITPAGYLRRSDGS